MEVNVDFEVGESHLALWERDDWRYAFLMGGRGNGRSGTASRYAVSALFGKEYMRGAIMRAVHSDIETSCWTEIVDRLDEQGVRQAKGLRLLEGDMYAQFGQNSLNALGFKASSGSLTARLKSLASYNFVWIEEAEEVGEDEFMKLDDSLRTTKGRIRVIFTLNTPAKSHWIIKRFFDLTPGEPGFYIPRLKKGIKDAIYIPGTFEDNLSNIDENTARRYRSYKDTKPAYYWQMIEGQSPEVVMGRIYQNWREIPAVPHEARLLGYGLDFGFDPDPAAVIAVYYHNGGYILDEKVYAKRLTNENLAAAIKMLPEAPIVADSAEPKSIEELALLRVNVIPCTKGPDSVDFGIKHVQSLRISYTASSTNLKDEYENYAWKRKKDQVEEDDHLGIEDPRCDNHAMSAARYFLTEMVKADADPEAVHRRQEQDRVRVSVTRRGLTKNPAR